jgi:hypothetical protein
MTIRATTSTRRPIGYFFFCYTALDFVSVKRSRLPRPMSILSPASWSFATANSTRPGWCRSCARRHGQQPILLQRAYNVVPLPILKSYATMGFRLCTQFCNGLLTADAHSVVVVLPTLLRPAIWVGTSICNFSGDHSAVWMSTSLMSRTCKCHVKSVSDLEWILSCCPLPVGFSPNSA